MKAQFSIILVVQTYTNGVVTCVELGLLTSALIQNIKERDVLLTLLLLTSTLLLLWKQLILNRRVNIYFEILDSDCTRAKYVMVQALPTFSEILPLYSARNSAH